MITIDNQEVTGVTINGDKVNEITMDGAVVWFRDYNFYIDYETSSGTQTQSFTTGALLRQFIMDNKTTFINHCKVVAKLPEITSCADLFRNCTATSIDLSSFDTSNVTNMRYVFSGSQATSLDLSSFDTSNVTNMWNMFSNCSATSLDLSSFDTSKVTNMRSMFYGSRATSLDLSSFDTSKVTDMRYMFENSRATTLDLSSFDTSSVTNMNSMFYGSKATTGYARTQADANRFNTSYNKPAGLTFVVKPDFYIEYETTTGTQYQEFTYGTDLESFILYNKESFINHCKVVAKLPEITNMRMMFMNCNATSLDLSSFNTSSATDMSYMFYQSQATSLDLSSFDTSNVTSMDGMFYNSQATTGYARTQADADKFNASSYKPAGLTFVVK